MAAKLKKPPLPATTGDGTSLPPNLEGGDQPRNRMPDATLTLQMINRRANSLTNKWLVWEEVQRKYDCEPPDDPGYLKANGLGHATNVSWGTMESRVDEIVETYYNLANGGKTFLRFHSRATGPMEAKLLATLAAEHKIMWDGWNGRQEMMETLVFNRSIYPFSAVYYDQPHGWWGKALHPRNLIYPDGAGTDCDTWFWCAVRTSFEAWQLLDKLKDESKASETGWEPSKIRKACEIFCRGNGAAVLASIGNGANWGNVVWDTIAPHDLAFNDRISAFIVYVKEWGGKVSEHILVNHTEVGYIYSKVGKHELLSDTLRIFPHGLGGGLLDSVRSYGVKTLSYHDALDRLTNSEFDTALITSSLILQADSGGTLDKMAELVFNVGGITALPSGFTPAQVNFRDSAAGLRLLKQDLRAQLGRNTPSLAGDVEIGDYEKSTKEAAMVYQTQLQLGLFKVDRFRTQMSGFCETHWKRLLACIKSSDENGGKEAKEFFKIAAARGVSPELLATIYRVTHKTGGARGNKVNEQLGMDRARTYIGMFSEDGKIDFARRDIGLALDDDDEAAAWLSTGQPGDAETEQARLAQLENSSMAGGQPVQTAGSDVDSVHMREHTAFLAAETEACKQGQRDPRACLATITLELQHVGPHFQRLSQDRFFAEAIKPLGEQWSQFENYRRQLTQQLQEQQEKLQRAQMEAMQTPQIDPKDAQALAAGEWDIRQKQEKHEQEMRHKEEDQALKRREEGANVRSEA